ncbi:DUF6896 domain-containing protein [Xanthomonas sacchari]|uniref:DUF6896 domain-containing protein n=1 Tax=Xanthomonas sacchari TaxID=56458 RepID=UPI0020C1D452|nr:hypothetical protein [Xanthomonas sacchari]
MKKQLARLIQDYQAKVHEALVVMHRSGIPMPDSRDGWIELNIPQAGLLDGGIAYFKHGAGCKVYLADGAVDFDFGDLGEIDGFDAWRLFMFSKRNFSEYGFKDQNDLERCFEASVAEGYLVCSRGVLFYISDVVHVFAVDIDTRLQGDTLPPRNLDSVLLLNDDYFQVADLMFLNCGKLLRKWDKDGHLSGERLIDARIYLRSWLGFLAVTCEGFESLGMRRLLRDERPLSFGELTTKSDAVGSLIKEHRKPLWELRNKTFHLRKDADAIRKFFLPGAGRIPWARELHQAFKEFFSNYRVECEVHYILNGRRGEVSLKSLPHKRRQ